MNPMLESLGSKQAGALKTILSSNGDIQSSILQAQLRNHPLYSQAEQIASQYGGDWNLAFIETAKKNGIDPNRIMDLIRQKGLV